MIVSPEELQKARQLLGQKLKHYREAIAAKTQQALADDAGIDRSWVINIEKGHDNYSIDELISLVVNCGVSFEDFLAGLERTTVAAEHRDYHKDLNTILNSGSGDLVNGIRVNLRAIAKEAIALKSAARAATRVSELDRHAKGNLAPNEKRKRSQKVAG